MPFNRMLLIPALALALLASAPVASAQASDLKPIQSRDIALGEIAGDAYYTVQPAGYDVVATLAQRGGTGTPVRVEAVLQPGQSVTLSTPRAVGTAPYEVVILRQADQILVRETPITN